MFCFFFEGGDNHPKQNYFFGLSLLSLLKIQKAKKQKYTKQNLAMIFTILMLFISCFIIGAVIITLVAIVNSPLEDTPCESTYIIGETIHTLPPNFPQNVDGMTIGLPPKMLSGVADELLKMLSLVNTNFKQSNVEFWLTKSSLLGAVRHQGLIPWHPRIHLGFSHDDLAKVVGLRSVFESGGEYLFQTKIDGYRLVTKNFSRFPEICFTVFSVKSDEVSICTPLTELLECSYNDSFRYREQVFDVIDVFPLVSLPFEHLSILAPHHPIECVEQMYGSNFMHQIDHAPSILHNPKTQGLLKRLVGCK